MHGFPTVLVARNNDGLKGLVANRLKHIGINVLEADDWEDVFHFITSHSRPIHVLLADASIEGHLPIIKEYRSELEIFFVKAPADEADVVAKVRKLLALQPVSNSVKAASAAHSGNSRR